VRRSPRRRSIVTSAAPAERALEVEVDLPDEALDLQDAVLAEGRDAPRVFGLVRVFVFDFVFVFATA